MNTVDLATACWRKSSHSGGDSGDCVEIASVISGVAVRDSKDPDGPRLVFASAEWRAFARRIKAGAANPA